MPLVHLDHLPPRTTKGELLRFVCETGGIDGDKVGRIDLHGALATIEVPATWAPRLAKKLDGAVLKERRLRAWCGDVQDSPAAHDDHFRRLARLLELESAAEAAQTLEAMRSLSPAD